MGQQESTTKTKRKLFVQNNFEQFLALYPTYKKSCDKIFGEIEIFRNIQTGSKIFTMEKAFSNYMELEEFVLNLETRGREIHPNIVQIFGYQSTIAEELCGTSSTVLTYLEYFGNTLQDDIYNRIQENQLIYYTQDELLRILADIVSGSSYLTSRYSSHGDIRPENIHLDQQNRVKLFDNSYNPQKNFLSYLLYGESNVFLSPEQMKAIAKKDTNPSYNQEKADVYSLGMTMLYASNLTNPLKLCYDQINPQIWHNEVDELLKLAFQLYGFEYVDLLRKMLMDKEMHRPSFQQLMTELARVVPHYLNQNFSTISSFSPQKNQIIKSNPQYSYQPLVIQLIIFFNFSQQPQQIQQSSQQQFHSSPVQYMPQQIILQQPQYQQQMIQQQPSGMIYNDKDMDKKVQDAIKKTEAIIQKNQFFLQK